MTAPEQGIDLSRSGWTNPDGFERSPRPSITPPRVEACEAPGPDGWVCDLPPNHNPQDQHKADDGTAQGIRWTGAMADVRTIADPEPVLIPAYFKPSPAERAFSAAASLTTIAELAQAALENPSPAGWAVALDKILRVARGE